MSPARSLVTETVFTLTVSDTLLILFLMGVFATWYVTAMTEPPRSR